MTYYELVENCMRHDCMSCPYYDSHCVYFKHKIKDTPKDVGLIQIRNCRFVDKLNDNIETDFELEVCSQGVIRAYETLIRAFMKNEITLEEAVSDAIGYLSQALDEHPDINLASEYCLDN